MLGTKQCPATSFKFMLSTWADLVTFNLIHVEIHQINLIQFVEHDWNFRQNPTWWIFTGRALLKFCFGDSSGRWIEKLVQQNPPVLRTLVGQHCCSHWFHCFSTHSWPARRQNVCHARQNELCVDPCFSPFRVWFIDVRVPVIPVTCHPKKRGGPVIHLIWRRWGWSIFWCNSALIWMISPWDNVTARFQQVGRIPESRLLEAVMDQKFVLPGSLSATNQVYIYVHIYIYIIYTYILNYCITMKIKVKQTYIQICTHSIHVFRSAQFACLFGKRSSLNQSLPPIFPVPEVSFNILAVPYARTQLATQIMFLGCTMLCRVAIFDNQFLLDFQPRVGETLKRTCWTMTKRTTALPVFLNPCTASAIVYPGIHIVHPKSLITRTGNLS